MRLVGTCLIILSTSLYFASPTSTQSNVKDEIVRDFILVGEAKGDRANIYEISVDTGEVRPLLPPHVSRDAPPLAVAVDAEDNTIYWTNAEYASIGKYRKTKVSKRDVDQSSEYSTVLRRPSDDNTLDCLALDQVRHVLYFCSRSANGTGAIGRIDTSGQNEAIFLSNNFMEPGAIVLDEQKGHLYWSDMGKEPGIYRTSLTDPQQRTTIVYSNIIRPCGLAIDFKEGWIYWTDIAKKSIEKCRLDGSERSKIFDDSNPDYFSLTFNRNDLFFTDWNRPTVGRLSKYGGRVTLLSQSMFEMPSGIALVSRRIQRSATQSSTDPRSQDDYSVGLTSTTTKAAVFRTSQQARQPSTHTHSAKVQPKTSPGHKSDFFNSTPLGPISENLDDNGHVGANIVPIVAGSIIAVLILLVAIFIFVCKRCTIFGKKTHMLPKMAGTLVPVYEPDGNIYDVIHYEEENTKNEQSVTPDFYNYDDVVVKNGLLTGSDEEVRYTKPTNFLHRDTEDGYLKPTVHEHQYAALNGKVKSGYDTEYDYISK